MDFHELGERDHELQNPTSAEKIRLLGEYLRLDADSRVLDIACGKAGPAIVLASTFGCRSAGVERREAFADEARPRMAGAGLPARVEVHTGDGKAFPLEPAAFDAALCIGASFVWGTIADAVTALVPAVKHGGFVAVGEPYWRRGRQHPESRRVAADDFVPLTQTIERFTAAGVALTG